MTELHIIVPGISTDFLVHLLGGCALCGHMQVYLDGGPFSPDTAAPYDPQHGWQHDRHQLLQRASGLCGAADAAQGVGLMLFTDDASAAAAGDLADSLQRVWLLVEATAELQDSSRWLSGSGHNMPTGAADKLTAAIKTLYLVRRWKQVAAAVGWAGLCGRHSENLRLGCNTQHVVRPGSLADWKFDVCMGRLQQCRHCCRLLTVVH